MGKASDLRQVTVYVPENIALEMEAEVEARRRTGRRTTLAALARELLGQALDARREPVRKVRAS